MIRGTLKAVLDDLLSRRNAAADLACETQKVVNQLRQLLVSTADELTDHEREAIDDLVNESISYRRHHRRRNSEESSPPFTGKAN
jgi:hypothetical protein